MMWFMGLHEKRSRRKGVAALLSVELLKQRVHDHSSQWGEFEEGRGAVGGRRE